MIIRLQNVIHSDLVEILKNKRNFNTHSNYKLLSDWRRTINKIINKDKSFINKDTDIS